MSVTTRFATVVTVLVAIVVSLFVYLRLSTHPSAAASAPAPAATTTKPAPKPAPMPTNRAVTASKPVTAHRPVPAAALRPAPCAGNREDQLVKVSIAAQHLWMCHGSALAYQTAVTTGMDTPDTRTPTGTFHIQGRNRDSVLTLEGGQQYDVRYWIPFQAPDFGFHDSSWQTFPYGSPQYRSAGSHGCVHMPLAAIAYLYNWVDIGATVVIA